MRQLAVLVAIVAIAGCIDVVRAPTYTGPYDASVRRVVGLAEAASRTSGFTIAEEDVARAMFVAAKAGATPPLLVQIATPRRVFDGPDGCVVHCMTTIRVSPLRFAGADFVVDDHASDADEAGASQLLAAIRYELAAHASIYDPLTIKD